MPNAAHAPVLFPLDVMFKANFGGEKQIEREEEYVEWHAEIINY